MFSLTMAAAQMPTADELSAAVEALMKEEKSSELDVKQIHERLLKDRNWKVPERRLNKFVKRHRGGSSSSKAASGSSDEVSPARKTTQGVFKKLFQRKSPEPAAKTVGGGGGGAKPGATVVTDQSPGRMSTAASLESSVLPDPLDLDGVPSTIVTTTTTSSENQAAPAAVGADTETQVLAAADVSVANKPAGEADDDEGESQPCFMLPCEGMSCSVL